MGYSFGRESWGAHTRASTPVDLGPLHPCQFPLLFYLQSVVWTLVVEGTAAKTSINCSAESTELAGRLCQESISRVLEVVLEAPAQN